MSGMAPTYYDDRYDRYYSDPKLLPGYSLIPGGAEEGDEVSITVKGKLVRHRSGGGVHVHVARPGFSPYQSDDGTLTPYVPVGSPSVDFTINFHHSAEIVLEYKSQYKNGVHIDAEGTYWMKRPDGWHRMEVEDATHAVGPRPGKGGPQRLKEAKD